NNAVTAFEYAHGEDVVSSGSDRFFLCRFVENGGGWWGGPVLIPRNEYTLELRSVSSRAELDDLKTKSHVILASVNGGLHIRITGSNSVVVDKPRSLLVDGPSLTELEELMLQDPLPQLSPEDQREVLMKI